MELGEFLASVDFVHGYGENPRVVIKIGRNFYDVRLVERAMGGKDQPIVIVGEPRSE